MKRSTAKKTVLFTLAFTVVSFFVCLGFNHPILAAFLAVVGYFVMYAAASSINPNIKRPRAARRRFLRRHHDNLETFETNELLVGSSAGVIANDLTAAFQTGDRICFTDSLNTFDHDAFASNFSTDSNSSSFSIIDNIHGGTDSTGMGGMGGHNDQGWGTDSHSSICDSSFSANSNDSFSSSCSHDPFG